MSRHAAGLRTNRLAGQKSPYLLQHAHNPVDWWPWGPEAFEQARTTGRPVFLSIGYSTCHWCHVMAEESFEDPVVAAALNETFVCIKVDREERPDIDAAYMTAAQLLTGTGGWPLTIVMAPDGRPFFAATYLPSRTSQGLVGLLDLAPKIRDLWSSRREDLLNSAGEIAGSLLAASESAPGKPLDRTFLDKAAQELRSAFDQVNGGFGRAPKFPTPHALMFLLRHAARSSSADELAMVEKTLLAIRCGGIYDQLVYGVHRYSTDSQWLVPHFEKMLYDQALLTLACVDAFQATGKEDYARIARETIGYVTRNLTDPGGAFIAAEDADTEGVEGGYYLWTEQQLRQAIADADDAAYAADLFNVRPEGNHRAHLRGAPDRSNILHLAPPGASSSLLPESGAGSRAERVRLALYAARKGRTKPGSDGKVLADWNGLMIAALARAGRLLGEPAFTSAATRAADFVYTRMADGQGKLLHRYRDGEAAVPAMADDYAFMAWGLVELFDATGDRAYIDKASRLAGVLTGHFWDGKAGGFFLTADDAEKLVVRPRDFLDGAVPSANSVAMLVLARLGRLTGDKSLEEKAVEIGAAASEGALRAPSAYAMLMVALDELLFPAKPAR